MELEKICRLCLQIKRDMRNLFTDNIISMLEEFCSIKISKEDGWPSLVCSQCVHQVSRCHTFKKRIEKSDETLKQYIKSLTIIVEEPAKPEIRTQTIQPHVQEIQIQRPEPAIQQTHHPLIITNLNPAAMLNGQQLIQTSGGQIIQAQIGQFVQGPNNIQMITTNPISQSQLLQIRPESDNRLTELIVQPTEISEPQFYEEIPILVQSANGQQTIVNLPQHQVHQLQQQQQQQVAQLQQVTTTSSSEPDEIEIHEVQNFEDEEYDLEEVIEDDNEQEIDASNATTTFYLQRTAATTASTEENLDTDLDIEDKQLFAEFLAAQTHTEGPNKHICNLCQSEFKQMKWLESHMRTIHSNWIKANCKKQPQCQICFKSFRGPGMLKMHQKTHERENKQPTCSICGKEFKSKSILYRHRATHFADQKQHVCTICNKTFNSNYQLNAHVSRHQKNQCTQCEKCFANANDLKCHLQQEHHDKKIIKTS
ncbi:hypothetical protein PVAND_003798 [Polypedilum vanderplanki]|uniref:Zinc finger protein n=1 Tax=Polypedilum vanderplanki TaxID=319348 RepID=A0A9J6BVN0_POLVA|nr:hypothetical protein PVAND_003798 [Polypedilum vanderplanki]